MSDPLNLSRMGPFFVYAGFLTVLFCGLLQTTLAGNSFVISQYDLTCLAVTGFKKFAFAGGSTRPLWKRENKKVYRDEFASCCDIPTYFPVQFKRLSMFSYGDDTG